MTFNEILWESETLMDHVRELREDLFSPSASEFARAMDKGRPLNWVREPACLTETARRIKKEVIEEKEKHQLKFFDPKELDLDD